MGAYGNFVLDKAFDVNQAITKFRFVKMNATLGTIGVGQKPVAVPVTANTDIVAGVAQESVATTDISRGKGLPVRMGGISEMEAGGTVTVGDQIATDASGRAVTLGSGGAGSVVYGIAMGSATIGNRVAVRLVNV